MGPSIPLPSMVCDVSFLEVELVQEGLPIKQMVKWLRSNFKESWPTSKETASEPEGDPACEEGETEHGFLALPMVGHGEHDSSPVRWPLLYSAGSDFYDQLPHWAVFRKLLPT